MSVNGSFNSASLSTPVLERNTILGNTHNYFVLFKIQNTVLRNTHMASFFLFSPPSCWHYIHWIASVEHLYWLNPFQQWHISPLPPNPCHAGKTGLIRRRERGPARPDFCLETLLGTSHQSLKPEMLFILVFIYSFPVFSPLPSPCRIVLASYYNNKSHKMKLGAS